MDTISRIYTEVWFYVVVFGGFVQGSFVGAFGVITLLATPTRFRSRIWRGFLKFLNFNVVLLIVGAFACGLWAFVAYPRWYIYADPVVSYQPVIPFGQWVLDATFGSFRGALRNGASLVQLQIFWFFLTLAVWLSAIHLNRKLLRVFAAARDLAKTRLARTAA